MSKDTAGMVAAQRISSQMLLEARDYGIEIICASNAAFMQGDIVKECLCLEAAGFSRQEILRSATLATSESLKPLCQTGTFAANSFADVLFLAGNPLDDLLNLRKINTIMLGGKPIDN